MWFAIFLSCLSYLPQAGAKNEPADAGQEERALELASLRSALGWIGLDFDEKELGLMLANAREQREGYARLRERSLDNSVVPALGFEALLPGMELRRGSAGAGPTELEALAALAPAPLPAEREELCYWTIAELAPLVRSRAISCRELAELFLARLERLDAELHCVVSYTRERALAQADALDRELAEGRWRGPLHGIPWGAKDLLAARGAPTTWGAKPYEEQVLDRDATVVERLDAAGAVLIAKLSLGSLAMGDVWFRGRTRNPWNPERGSSGSSAGSAAATSAGGVVFSIGSETLGSIVSPSQVCGTTSLRPTFGRVSRQGAMALSWSMDKLGPLTRSAVDCWLVLRAIQGPDGRDPSCRAQPWSEAALASYPLDGLRVGIPAGAFERDQRAQSVLSELEALGCDLVEVELPRFPTGDMLIVLEAEAATAFDELTRDGRDDLLTAQGRSDWPNLFRAARLVPAVEYLRAQRLRSELMLAFDRVMSEVDVLVHPPYGADVLTITNLTGHPTFVAPAGFDDEGRPYSICLTGQLFDEERLLALAARWQASTDYHRRHPALGAVHPEAK